MHEVGREVGFFRAAEAVLQNIKATAHTSGKVLAFKAVAPTIATNGRATDGEMHFGDVLERMGCGYVVLDEHKRIVMTSAIARRLLDREDRGGFGNLAQQRCVLQELVDRGRGRLAVGAFTWIAVSRENGLTFSYGQAPDLRCGNAAIVVLLDLDANPVPNPDTLKRLFGLTFAEARLAVQLAQGRTPDEVARNRRVSRTTVRSQLGSIFAKTNTRRQAALVSLLGRVALLP